MKRGKLKVKVTATDIAKGTPESVHYCPVARALRRMGFVRIAIVGDATFARRRDGNLSTWNIGVKGRRFTSNFDKGLRVWPQTLRLTKRSAATR